MPQVQKFNNITKHIFPSEAAYIKAMELGKVNEGDEVYIEGIDEYKELADLPKLNGVTIVGDKTASEFGLQEELSELSTTEIIELWNKIMNE